MLYYGKKLAEHVGNTRYLHKAMIDNGKTIDQLYKKIIKEIKK